MSAEVLASQETTPDYDPVLYPPVHGGLSENQTLYDDTPLFAAILDKHQDASVVIPHPRPSGENTIATSEDVDFYTTPQDETPFFTAALKPYLDIRAADIAALGAMAAVAETRDAHSAWAQRLLTDVDYTVHTPEDYIHARAPRPQPLSRTSIWNIEEPDHPASPQETIVEKWPVHAKGFGLTVRPPDMPLAAKPEVHPLSSLRVIGRKIAAGLHKIFPKPPKRLPI